MDNIIPMIDDIHDVEDVKQKLSIYWFGTGTGDIFHFLTPECGMICRSNGRTRYKTFFRTIPDNDGSFELNLSKAQFCQPCCRAVGLYALMDLNRPIVDTTRGDPKNHSSKEERLAKRRARWKRLVQRRRDEKIRASRIKNKITIEPDEHDMASQLEVQLPSEPLINTEIQDVSDGSDSSSIIINQGYVTQNNSDTNITFLSFLQEIGEGMPEPVVIETKQEPDISSSTHFVPCLYCRRGVPEKEQTPIYWYSAIHPQYCHQRCFPVAAIRYGLTLRIPLNKQED